VEIPAWINAAIKRWPRRSLNAISRRVRVNSVSPGVSGAQTAGRYCLIDMLVPNGGGPPPHRHDFEEMFTLLEGDLEFTFRGQSLTVHAGSTVNIPANAPHMFKNKSGKTVHMLCMCTPAGQEEFFVAVGIPVDSRTSPPPKPSKEEQAEKGKLLETLLPKYRTEIVKP
jgi:quercetin dioxygenase-like cupin family protein